MDLATAIFFSVLLVACVALCFAALHDGQRLIAMLFAFGVVVCFWVILSPAPTKTATHYNAECGDKNYNVYENKDGFYLTETNKRIVLSEYCTLIETDND